MARTYIKLDGNLVAIFLGANVVPEPQGETWLINESASALSNITFTVDFTSNNTNFDKIQHITGFPMGALYYGNTKVADTDTPTGDIICAWTNQAYRTVTFETAPTGDLLTWLQANAVKQ